MKILLTGGSGFLGRAILPLLRLRGHSVTALQRRPACGELTCDLTDADATRRAVDAAGPFDAVVHLAAIAHGFRDLELEDFVAANVSTTSNLLEALTVTQAAAMPRFVFASSVAVYDVLKREPPVLPSCAPYAMSKLICESLLCCSGLKDLSVLRYAPIFDEEHLLDIAKRVFLPGMPIRIRLYPEPHHQFCRLATAVAATIAAIEKKPLSRPAAVNVYDQPSFGQHALCAMFRGPAMPMPTVILRAVLSVLKLLGPRSCRLQLAIRKFALPALLPPAELDSVNRWRVPPNSFSEVSLSPNKT